jgi:beta-galactosidase beta subunit
MQTLSHSSKGCVLKMDDGRTITVQEENPVLIKPQEIATPTAPVVAEPVKKAVKKAKKA